MPDRIPTTRCIPADQKIEMIANVVNSLVDTGLVYTAGDAIDATQLAAEVIQVKYDNSTISLNGSGQLQAITGAALTAGCGVDITAGVASAAVDGTTIDCVGGNLTVIVFAFGSIAVSGQSTVVADQVSDTLNLAAGANVTITTTPGSDTITIASTDTNTTYTAGAGINLSGTKFIADPNAASHVGLVDPTTGADSSADDAQLGVLWHTPSGYSSSGNRLYGTADADTTKPVVRMKTVADWLKTLPQYDAAKKMVLTADAGTVEWNEVDVVLNWLAGYDTADNQSIGHNSASGATQWQDDGTACP